VITDFTVIASTTTGTGLATDNRKLTYFNDPSATCYIGFDFGADITV
jgi:hypothetical protein